MTQFFECIIHFAEIYQCFQIRKMTTPLVLSQDDIEAGGNKHEFSNHGIENDFTYNNNVHSANISIRLGNLLTQNK